MSQWVFQDRHPEACRSLNQPFSYSDVGNNVLKRLKKILNNREMAIVLVGGFSNGELVKILHGGQASNMEELYSTQEETDICLLLHAIHASQNHSRV